MQGLVDGNAGRAAHDVANGQPAEIGIRAETAAAGNETRLVGNWFGSANGRQLW